MLRTKGSRKGCHAFTLVELLVVVAIIALLISILLPTLSKAQEKARQVMCTSNLRGIFTAWSIYTGAHNGSPPILYGGGGLYAYEDGLKMSDDCTTAALGTGSQQNLCLLVKAGTLQWEIFICPSTDHEPASRSGSGRKFGLGETVGGEDRSYCDYGIQGSNTYYCNYCPLNKFMDGDVVVMGDRGPPSLYDYQDEWSPNHPKDGESLLYFDGHVRFSKDKNSDDDKNTGGWGGNNVYTRDHWTNPESDSPILTGNNNGWNKYAGSTKDTVLHAWPSSF